MFPANTQTGHTFNTQQGQQGTSSQLSQPYYYVQPLPLYMQTQVNQQAATTTVTMTNPIPPMIMGSTQHSLNRLSLSTESADGKSQSNSYRSSETTQAVPAAALPTAHHLDNKTIVALKNLKKQISMFIKLIDSKTSPELIALLQDQVKSLILPQFAALGYNVPAQSQQLRIIPTPQMSAIQPQPTLQPVQPVFQHQVPNAVASTATSTLLAPQVTTRAVPLIPAPAVAVTNMYLQTNTVTAQPPYPSHRFMPASKGLSGMTTTTGQSMSQVCMPQTMNKSHF